MQSLSFFSVDTETEHWHFEPSSVLMILQYDPEERLVRVLSAQKGSVYARHSSVREDTPGKGCTGAIEATCPDPQDRWTLPLAPKPVARGGRYDLTVIHTCWKKTHA
ncbi:hypothetical protein NDU88_005158 [Pleurodeles waltl]|uniref:Uncharacterized protein n=1 Tax=Pleurodeles waltl TaxID=8319 RepID=A0AAV7WU05_PLEWA|nr:hypothetical protein NDU88_005158 [Pleurodeles waltl]